MAYGNYAYYDYMLFRTNIISRLLQNHINVWLIESDAVWLRDPSSVVLNQKADIITMSDAMPPKKLLRVDFQFLRSTDKTIRAWKRLVLKFSKIMLAESGNTKMGDRGSEQLLFDSIIKDNSLDLDVLWLDPLLFLPGLYYKSNKKYPNAIVILNNWIIGNRAKIERAKKYKQWFLDVNGQCVDAPDY